MSKIAIHAILIPIFAALIALFILAPAYFLLLLITAFSLLGIFLLYKICYDGIRDYYEDKAYRAKSAERQKELDAQYNAMFARLRSNNPTGLPDDPVRTDA